MLLRRFSFYHFFHSSTFLGQIGMVLTSFVWKRLNMGFPIGLLGLSLVNWLYSSCKAGIFSAVFFGLIMTMLAFPNCSMTSTTVQFVHSLEILLISILHLSSFFFSEPCHICKITQEHLFASFILQIFKSFLVRSTNEYSTSSFSQN